MWEPPSVLLGLLHENAEERAKIVQYLQELWAGLKALIGEVGKDPRAKHFVRDLKWPQSQYCLEWL
eukprot:5039685-Amphidinium_carterae.1